MTFHFSPIFFLWPATATFLRKYYLEKREKESLLEKWFWICWVFGWFSNQKLSIILATFVITKIGRIEYFDTIIDLLKTWHFSKQFWCFVLILCSKTISLECKKLFLQLLETERSPLIVYPIRTPPSAKYMGLSNFCNNRILCKDFITSYLKDYGYTLEDQNISTRLS